MITRLSKIARLPAKTREQLNRRLHDGQLSRTILPWVNSLPKTKKIMAELFGGKPITHQNLSEWRRTGYQDWLFHQQRIDWFDRLTEEEKDFEKHDKCNDTFEAMSNYFLYELGHAVRALQTIKNPFERMERMQHLSREFARLQNAFNWSRRVQLEWDKANHRLEPKPDVQPARPTLGSSARPRSAGIPACGSSGLSSPESKTPKLSDTSTPPQPSVLPGAGGASVPASDPSPNSDLPTPIPNSHPSAIALATAETPEPLNSLTQTKCQPLPPLAPPTPPPQIPTPNSYLRTSRAPVRGRRFICIEG